MKLELNFVEFKNFLSYGSSKHLIPFKNGVNIVLGKDIATGRSNGSGKSSFLETIPFALFGQTHKEIKKAQLLNWKNRRKLEVTLAFTRGEDEYIVTRAIKPDSLDIWENDNLIPKPAHVKDYQKQLEEIIGLNFNTFCSLIHSNINSSNRILSMGKPEKRKFIENVFGLGIYSQISEIALRKTRSIEEKLHEIDLETEGADAQITAAKEQNTELQIKKKNITDFNPELKESIAELKELEKEFPNIKTRHEKILKKIKTLKSKQEHYSRLDTKINAKNLLIERWIKDVDSKLCKVAETKQHQKMYFAFVKEHGKPSEIINKMADLKVDITKNTSNLETANAEYRVVEIELTKIATKLEAEEEKIDRLKSHNECPTCGQSLKGDIDILKQLNENVKMLNVDHKLETKKTDKIAKKIEKLTQKNLELNKMYDEVEERKDQLYKLKDAIQTDLKKEDLDKQLERYKNSSKCLTAQLGKTETAVGLIETKLIISNTEEIEIEKNIRKIESKKKEIEILEGKIKLQKTQEKELIVWIQTNKTKIKELQKDITDFNKKRKKFINIIDYMTVIREICKDDNIKQYAISSIMPFLNKRTNHYLSEVGYSFYTILNKWIEADIRGPGVTNASYGSLSGGEGRGIDLALQFALLDIAKVQAGIWPDILIMDEILDSSVDGPGIEKLMNLIRVRQEEENNKIFIISHREEVGDINPDNTYFVEKDRFSTLEIL